MRGYRQGLRRLLAAGIVLLLSAPSAWGYFFDERREMSLSGQAYTRATIQTSKGDQIGTGKGLWKRGNVVQHRNYLTLEWRHNLNRLSREFPTIGTLFQYVNLDAFDYYLNVREEFEGIWEYGGASARRQLDGGGGTEFWDKYYGRRMDAEGNYFVNKYPGELTRYKEFGYVSSQNFLEKKVQQLRLFEWYFNITKGPMFLRVGRQNLSWGEADAFRLLDQINPLDNGFGGFTTPLDERRIPLFMVRAQWNFGRVGPIQDLTLEGFVAPDHRTAAIPALHQGSMWSVRTNTSPVSVHRMPCGGPIYGQALKKAGNLGFMSNGNQFNCSTRARGPSSSIADSRGGGRIIGTIRDFTFSLAHYYTWSDSILSDATIGSPTPMHLAYDTLPDAFTALTGLAATPENNPWGPNDPCHRGGPSGLFAGTPCTVERNLPVPIHAKRVQITGGSLSFPLNALTSMFVDSSSPLFYLYTTIRAEFTYTRNNLLREQYAGGSESLTNMQRFMTRPLHHAGVTSHLLYDPRYLADGLSAGEGNCDDHMGWGANGIRGCRSGHHSSRDQWAFVLGIDHIQWIRFLNKSNSFVFSGQYFHRHTNNVKRYKKGVPVGRDNDTHSIGVTTRSAAPTGGEASDRVGGIGNRTAACANADGSSAPPCDFKRLLQLQSTSQMFTLAITTSYNAGNVRPRFVVFYDMAGAYLLQPGLDWWFYDPFRLSIRYNFIDGKYTGIGFFKFKDSIWFELQYLLY